MVENYDSTQPASVIGGELTPNSMASVALWVAQNAPVSTARSLIGDDPAQAFQRDLRAAVKTDVKLTGVPVYYYTQKVSINLGTYNNLADDANAVLYPVLGQAPGATIANNFLSFKMPMPYARVIAEAGHPANTTIASVNGVDPLTQAKQTLDLLFDAYSSGWARHTSVSCGRPVRIRKPWTRMSSKACSTSTTWPRRSPRRCTTCRRCWSTQARPRQASIRRA